MPLLIDGSNLLGRLGQERRSVDAKRALLTVLARVARRRRTLITCYFDGTRPEAFGAELGSLKVRFSESRTADDVIFAAVEKGHGERLIVVTSDAALAARLRRKNVRIVSCEEFRRELEEADGEHAKPDGEDWESYFSDEKNRNV